MVGDPAAPNMVLNCGVMLVRNGTQSVQLWKDIWDMEIPGSPLWENAALIQYWKHHVEEYHKHLALVEPAKLNKVRLCLVVGWTTQHLVNCWCFVVSFPPCCLNHQGTHSPWQGFRLPAHTGGSFVKGDFLVHFAGLDKSYYEVD